MARKAAKKSASRRGPAAGEPRALVEEVRQLVQLMVDNGLGEVEITDGDRQILLKRNTGAPAGPAPAAPAMAAEPAAAGTPVPPAAPAETGADQPPLEEFIEIRSPMVGTFYSAASPDSDPYVAVDAAVDEETVVCIVEAMKVMNEVRAECSGTVVETCLQNGQPVEYGQVLFRVRPG